VRVLQVYLDRGQPLLDAIMEVSLELSALFVTSLDEPRARVRELPTRSLPSGFQFGVLADEQLSSGGRREAYAFSRSPRESRPDGKDPRG
jgi:hypothetical protein